MDLQRFTGCPANRPLLCALPALALRSRLLLRRRGRLTVKFSTTLNV